MFCIGAALEVALTFVALVMRAIAAACARLGAPPPWLPETGCNGVLAPVLEDDSGGTRFPGESFNSEGICGSAGMEPSLCRSRSLISSRLTYRSSCSKVLNRNYDRFVRCLQVRPPSLRDQFSLLARFALVRSSELQPYCMAPP